MAGNKQGNKCLDLSPLPISNFHFLSPISAYLVIATGQRSLVIRPIEVSLLKKKREKGRGRGKKSAS